MKKTPWCLLSTPKGLYSFQAGTSFTDWSTNIVYTFVPMSLPAKRLFRYAEYLLGQKRIDRFDRATSYRPVDTGRVRARHVE